MKIVIVGHVDHGKSTLIGRLFYDTNSLPEGRLKDLKEASDALGKDLEFGFVLDHLEEERSQGITIDTTQKFFNTNKRNYTIIDAPGHIEFVKNMITGASQAEAAILIVDAEEGVKEQTKRHAYILSMLGLRQIIVIINKMDLVNYNQDIFEKVKKDTQEFLNKINIVPNYYIPVSAKQGDNIAKHSENLEWYREETLLSALDSFKISSIERSKNLRFAVQDVYNFEKRIFAGKVIRGVIKKGQEVLVLPNKELTKIKSIEVLEGELNEAFCGQNIGVTTEDKLFIDGGTILVDKDDDTYSITKEIKANVFWLDKIPYKKGERLIIKCSTQEIMCELEIKKVIDSSTLETISVNGEEIKNREVAEVVIKTEKPVVIENFHNIQEMGRFVLERKDTSAGGIIV